MKNHDYELSIYDFELSIFIDGVRFSKIYYYFQLDELLNFWKAHSDIVCYVTVFRLNNYVGSYSIIEQFKFFCSSLIKDCKHD